MKYGIATLLIPLLVASVTQPDRYSDFRLDTAKQRAILWILKLTGALVGFYAFSMPIIGMVLVWYYLYRPPLRTEFVAMLAVVPLFVSYVVARRIPADRYKMFNGNLQAHSADYLFLSVFTFAGPLTALFMYAFYWFLSDRTMATVIILALIGMALWEYRKQKRSSISDVKLILVLGFFIPLCILILSFFLTSNQPLPSYDELPSIFLALAYFLSATLLTTTLFVRNKPILSFTGLLGCFVVLILATLILSINIWLARGFIVAVALIWILWGHKRFKTYFWLHGSGWGMLVAIGSSLYLLASATIPLWANIPGFMLVSGLLIRWAYRKSAGG